MSLTVGSKISEFGVDFSPVLKSDVTLKELKGYLRIDDDIRGVVVLQQGGVRAEKNECTYYRIDDRIIRGIFTLFEKNDAFSDQEVEDVKEFLFKMVITAKHCKETIFKTSEEEFSAALTSQTNIGELWVKSFRIPVVKGEYHIATQELKPASKLTVAEFRQFV